MRSRPPQDHPLPMDPRISRPRLLGVVCLLVLVEAALLAGLAAAFGIELARGASAPGAVAFLLAFLMAVAVVLALAARGLWRGRRWARAPVLTWQLLLGALAVGWWGVEPTWWAAGVLVVAVAVATGLVLPAVVAATTGARAAPVDDLAKAAPDAPS